jgi:hypothetical protein
VIGAGEGNRTLVISLEGPGQAFRHKANSDNPATKRPLRPLANSFSSECARSLLQATLAHLRVRTSPPLKFDSIPGGKVILRAVPRRRLRSPQTGTLSMAKGINWRGVSDRARMSRRGVESANGRAPSIMAPLLNSHPRRPPPPSKSELRAMLAEAMANTNDRPK